MFLKITRAKFTNRILSIQQYFENSNFSLKWLQLTVAHYIVYKNTKGKMQCSRNLILLFLHGKPIINHLYIQTNANLQSKDTYFHCEVFPVEYLSKIKDFDAISFEPKTAQFDALCKILQRQMRICPLCRYFILPIAESEIYATGNPNDVTILNTSIQSTDLVRRVSHSSN